MLQVALQGLKLEEDFSLIKAITDKLTNSQKEELLYYMQGPSDISSENEKEYKRIIDEAKTER